MPVGVVRETVLSTLREALEEARAAGDLKLTTRPALVLDVPKKEAWGDLATTVAMTLAASEQRAPRDIAELIAGRLRSRRDVLERIEVAAPGFINLTVNRDLWFRVLAEIEAQGVHYGSSTIGLGQKVLLEFISANPTGPLHMGHGRGAAVGGALANLLRVMGDEVSTEYYINDAGRQVKLLAESVESRYRQLLGQEAALPEDGYQGLYVDKIAKGLLADRQATGQTLLPDGLTDLCGSWAPARMLDGIKADLSTFGLHFDAWFSERSLFETGAVERALDALKSQGYLFEQDGALWFRSTAFGDDKDRVVRKQDGEFTYLASDIAYHREKLARGYDLLINIWGADHHGYIPRMQAVVQAFGSPKERLHVVLVQIVNLLRDGRRVTMSKRAGELITLKEVIEEVGADAEKFIFLTRRSDSALDFDLELAKQRSAENPVYYVQYAHARVASLFRVAAERGVVIPLTAEVDWRVLNTPDDLALIKPLADYPSLLEAGAQALEPHRVTYYLQDLAARLHAYYYKHRILPPALEHEIEVQDRSLQRGPVRPSEWAPMPPHPALAPAEPEARLQPDAQETDQGRQREVLTPALTAARLCLLRGVQTVIRNGLEILGVSAPERM
jgi:arginyl-tRNA synthetase